jgi:hypothetical protein
MPDDRNVDPLPGFRVECRLRLTSGGIPVAQRTEAIYN